ncbi:hypothetical protein D3C81_1616500 [compost metagenome]
MDSPQGLPGGAGKLPFPQVHSCRLAPTYRAQSHRTTTIEANGPRRSTNDEPPACHSAEHPAYPSRLRLPGGQPPQAAPDAPGRPAQPRRLLYVQRHGRRPALRAHDRRVGAAGRRPPEGTGRDARRSVQGHACAVGAGVAELHRRADRAGHNTQTEGFHRPAAGG